MQISGSPSSQDAAAYQQDIFNKIDTDGSQGISKDELSAFLSSASGGSATSGATSTGLNIDQIFSQIDTNGDGVISQSENNAFLQAHQGQGAQGAHGAHRGHHGGHHNTNKIAASLFAAADTDGDGTVTTDQLKAALPQGTNPDAANALIDPADTNGDGVVTLAELEAALRQNQPQPTSYNRNGDTQTGTSTSTISAIG